jgi:iron complex transport system substrate-binding protein
MKYILTIALLFLLAVLGVQALEVPGDLNGDKVVSVEEVAAAEKLVQEGKLSADEVEEIKHIHKKYPISITDSENRTITIYKPIEKTIILHTTGYEPLLVLGAQNKLAAVTSTAK